MSVEIWLSDAIEMCDRKADSFLTFLYDIPCPTQQPTFSVPYQGTPKYSTRRRMGSQIIRRRSLSQSSLCSAQFDRCYQTPQGIHMPSPSPSRASINNNSDYGTLRRIRPEDVQNQMAGFEPNVQRILVIPRGPKGFGFILRGTKRKLFSVVLIIVFVFRRRRHGVPANSRNTGVTILRRC